MLSILASSGASSAAGMGGMILWLVILFAFMYFFMIRPQKKETQKSLLSLEATRTAVSQCRNLQLQQLRNRKKHNVNRVLYHKTSAVAGVLSVSERASGKWAAYRAAVSRMIRIKI